MSMTKIPGVPSRDLIRPGMAFYIGTGPGGKTCGDCWHNGYYDRDANEYFDHHCRMYRKLAGERGAPIKDYYAACRYFEDRDARSQRRVKEGLAHTKTDEEE